jgi:hypothetical protein
MALWWICDGILFVLILPVVVALLQAVVRPAHEIGATAQALAAASPVLVEHLDSVIQLATTQQLVHETTAGLARYGAALDRVL